MNPILGWGLAALLVALAWQGYGWKGVVLAVTATVFWLLLQFGRALRVMRNAANAPVGHVPSAVSFNARLGRGMTMMQVVTLTKSLGRKLDDGGDAWAWEDGAGDRVSLHFENGRLARFALERARPAADEPGPAGPAPSE